MINRRVNVRGIIYKDGKVLGQQLLPDHNGIVRDYWCTPGGGLEPGESLIDGLTREMVEETGIVPKIGKLLFVQQFMSPRSEIAPEQLEFFFNIENADDYENIDLANTSHGPLEIQKVEFIDPKTHGILPDFLQTIDYTEYIDKNKDTLIISKL